MNLPPQELAKTLSLMRARGSVPVRIYLSAFAYADLFRNVDWRPSPSQKTFCGVPISRCMPGQRDRIIDESGAAWEIPELDDGA